MRDHISLSGARLLAVVLLAGLLAGCGGGLFRTPEPVEITFLYLENAADYQPLAEEFTRQHPNITINLKAARGYQNLLIDLSRETESADAMRLPGQVFSPEMAQAFLPLDSLLSTGQTLDTTDLFDGSLEALRLDGKQIGLPAGLNPFVVYYLPEKFAAAGVPAPAPNWTVDDFVAAAMAIHNPDEGLIGTPRYTYGFCSHPQLTDIALFTYLFGGSLFDSLVQTTGPELNTSANVDAITWYLSLRDDFGVIPDRRTPREIGELIYRESCGFWVDWLDKSTFGPQGAPGAQPLPLPRHVTEFNVAVQDGYFIFSESEHHDEAYQWIRFLMEHESASGALIPPLRSLVNSEAYAARSPAAVVAVARTLPSQTIIFTLDMLRDQRMLGTIGLFGEAVQQVFTGQADPQTALDGAQQQAEGLFFP